MGANWNKKTIPLLQSHQSWQRTVLTQHVTWTSYSQPALQADTCKQQLPWEVICCLLSYSLAVLQSDCLQRELLFGYNAPGNCLVHVCLLHWVCVQLRNGYRANNATYAHAQGSDQACCSQKVTLSSKAIRLQQDRSLGGFVPFALLPTASGKNTLGTCPLITWSGYEFTQQDTCVPMLNRYELHILIPSVCFL